jgi:hypothetical protein
MKSACLKIVLGITFLLTLLIIQGCTKDESILPQSSDVENFVQITNPGLIVTRFYGLSDTNEIVEYLTGPPAKMMSSTPIIGLKEDEKILAIDFRPRNGLLYGVTNQSLLYMIDPVSGQAQLISESPFDPLIYGNTVGFDIDPISDQIRLVTDEDQNLRIDPDKGFVIQADNNIQPAAFAINAIAYPGIFSTTRPLYDIDMTKGVLFMQTPQSSGNLRYIGPLGLVIKGEGGFDIGKNAKSGLAVLYGHSNAGTVISGDDLSVDDYRVYDINLLRGYATYKGKMDRNIIGIAIP